MLAPDDIASESMGMNAEAGGSASMAQTPAAPETVTYSMSPGLVPLLQRLDVSIALTSYQSGRLYLLGRNPAGGLRVDEGLFQ